MSYVPSLDTATQTIRDILRRLSVLENTNPLQTGASVGGAATVAGGLTVSGVTAANGGLTTPGHGASSNVPMTPSANGCDIWVQAADPGASAANGDVWIAG